MVPCWLNLLAVCPLDLVGKSPSMYRAVYPQRHSGPKHVRGMPGEASGWWVMLAIAFFRRQTLETQPVCHRRWTLGAVLHCVSLHPPHSLPPSLPPPLPHFLLLSLPPKELRCDMPWNISSPCDACTSIVRVFPCTLLPQRIPEKVLCTELYFQFPRHGWSERLGQGL